MLRAVPRRAHGAALALATCLLPGAIWSPAGPLLPAAALELGGSTQFVQAPWKVDLVCWFTEVGFPSPDYFFTLTLPAGASAGLGRLTITQTRGVDRQFGFHLGASRAFVGRPRREGRPVPVVVTFDPDRRQFSIDIPEPVPPDTTLTVVLRPWRNPMQADTYMFQVTAYPAGPQPVARPVGFATLRIDQPGWRP
ncbi:MAG: DUF2808 domain-containing protein [Prochlorococcaceae cyanobacterium]